MVRIASTETRRAGDAFFLSVPPDLGSTYTPEAPKQSTQTNTLEAGKKNNIKHS